MRSVLLALLLGWSCSALAQEPTPLSAQGRQLLDGSFGASWSNARQPGLYYRTPHYAVWVQPTWVYFVRDGIGLGAYVGYRFARESTGIEGATFRQARPNPQLDERGDSYTHQPSSHDVSLGITAALELFASGRVRLFARPYLGLAVAWNELRTYDVFSDFGSIGQTRSFTGWEWRHELRPQAGIRLPAVYQLTSNLGLGLGPDLHWQRTSNGFHSFSAGISSWIARAF